MKLVTLLLLLTSTTIAAPYSKSIVYVLEQLRQDKDPDKNLSFIGGCAVGYGGTPGTFFLLHAFILNRASRDDLLKMLSDHSPAVRLMAAKVLIHSERYESDAKEADRLLGDSAKVEVAEFGCIVETMPVGEAVRRLKTNKNFLGDSSSYQLTDEPTPVEPPPPSKLGK
ncbi:MAG: hypothetical protein HY302_05970 [Opitutae bacterium]|nr:hypothetical protein [Opitutae bacterium]